MFFEFLLELRIRGIPVYVSDVHRIRLVLASGGIWSYERLMETLRSLLVRDVEQEPRFEDSFVKFFGSPFSPDFSIDTDIILEELRSADHILKSKDIPGKKQPHLPLPDETKKKSDGPEPGDEKDHWPDSEESPGSPETGFPEIDSLETDFRHQPLQGKREYSLKLPLPPLFGKEFFDGFSDDIGYFVTEESDDRIDIAQSLEKTCRKGYPEIIFKTRRDLRQILILKDQFIRKRMVYDPVDELAEGLSRRGLSVKRGIFYGSPEFFTHGDGGEYRLDDFDDNRNGFLVLVFSDSQGIDPNQDRILLEDMAQWPFLFWIETRPENQWDDITCFIGEYVPVYPSTRDSLRRISQQLRSETFRRESLPDIHHSESMEEILRDLLPWACACALLQPIDFGVAEHLRKTFFDSLPLEDIRLLLTLPGTTRTNDGLSFSIRTRNKLLAILRSRWPEKETTLRRELDTLFESDPDKPPENTAAYLIWSMHSALNKLQIDKDKAYSGAKMLSDLLSSQIGYCIEELFQKLVETDADSSNFVPIRPLDWDSSTQKMLKRLIISKYSDESSKPEFSHSSGIFVNRESEIEMFERIIEKKSPKRSIRNFRDFRTGKNRITERTL